MEKELDKSPSECFGFETPHLSFDSRNDAFNDCQKSVQDCINAVARDSSGTVESYAKGNCEIVLRVGFRSEQLDLIFHAIPKRIGGRLNGALATRMKADGDVIEPYQHRCNQSVLVSVAHFVECPKCKVPSFVSAESPKKRFNLFRDSTPFLYFTVEKGFITSKRETTRSKLRIDAAIDYSTGVDSMVECGAQVVDGIPGNNGKPIKRDWPTQAEYVDIVSGLRVCFDNYFVRVFGVDSYYPSVQVIDVMLCPVDLQS